MIEMTGYELLEELGRGGMATVYKARQPSLGRFIAIKVLPPYFAHDEEFTRRFKREALAVAKLRHPNIVQVYNFHQQDDLFYLAMEYIEGGSLADLLEVEGPLGLELSASIVKQTAAALDHAHQKGFIHRDIKPSNILLTADRQAVLTDFGITKAMDATRLTKTTFGGGTPEYMSPEQAKGDAVDGRGDFYSLGIVFYEMLTGRCPFEDANPLSIIHSQVYDSPPKPTEFNAAIPAPVEAIILKLLAKVPAQRFNNGSELVNKLAEVDFKEPPKKTFKAKPIKQKPTMTLDEATSNADEIEPKTKIKKPASADKPKETAPKANLNTPATTVKKPEAKAPVAGRSTTVKASAGAKSTKMKQVTSASRTKKANAKQTRIKKEPAAAKAKQTQVKKSPSKTMAKQTLVKKADIKAAPKKVKLPQQPVVKISTMKKNIISEGGQEASASRFKKFALIAASLAILGMVAAFAWSNLSNRYPFHYQFSQAISTVGQAKVVREINLQTNGKSKVLVVALRVKKGQGDVEVRESIPKSLAASVKDIKFNRPPTRIVNDDPVVLWRFKARETGTNLIYRVNVSKKFRPTDFDNIVADYKKLPKLNKIIFSGGALKVWVGQRITVKAAGIMSDESTNTSLPFVWESSNSKLAEVDNHGRLSAKQAGEMSVTVLIGKVKATLPVTVMPVLKSIRVQPEAIDIREGEAKQLSAVGTMSDGSNGPLKVKWSLVGEGGNGSIDSGGYFNAVTQGKVRIIAESGKIVAQIEVDIQAAPPSPPVSTSANRKSSGGQSRTKSRAPSPAPSPAPAPTPSPAPAPTPSPGGEPSGGNLAPSTNPPVDSSPDPINVFVD